MREDDPFKKKVQSERKSSKKQPKFFRKKEKMESKGEGISKMDQKGLRIRILTEIFKFLSYKDTLSCSLVSSEWLSISRSDPVWKNHFYRDFIDLESSTVDLLKSNQTPSFDPHVPAFLQYFLHLDVLLTLRSKKYRPKERMKRCGVKLKKKIKKFKNSKKNNYLNQYFRLVLCPEIKSAQLCLEIIPFWNKRMKKWLVVAMTLSAKLLTNCFLTILLFVCQKET